MQNQTVSTVDIQKKLNDYINEEINYWDFSGVIRIIHTGETIYETSRGYANIEFGIENTMDTLFSVASITKQFTAFAIMIILYKQGGVTMTLGERIKNYTLYLILIIVFSFAWVCWFISLILSVLNENTTVAVLSGVNTTLLPLPIGLFSRKYFDIKCQESNKF